MGGRGDKSGWSKFHVLHRKSLTTFFETLSAKNLYIPKVWRLGRRNFNILGYIGFLSTIPGNRLFQKLWQICCCRDGESLYSLKLQNYMWVFSLTHEMSLVGTFATIYFFVNYLSVGLHSRQVRLGCTASGRRGKVSAQLIVLLSSFSSHSFLLLSSFLSIFLRGSSLAFSTFFGRFVKLTFLFLGQSETHMVSPSNSSVPAVAPALARLSTV